MAPVPRAPIMLALAIVVLRDQTSLCQHKMALAQVGLIMRAADIAVALLRGAMCLRITAPVQVAAIMRGLAIAG